MYLILGIYIQKHHCLENVSIGQLPAKQKKTFLNISSFHNTAFNKYCKTNPQPRQDNDNAGMRRDVSSST